MASRLHRTLALVLSCNIAMTAFTASAFAADDTETASEGASVVHEHNKVNCPTCGGSHKVKVEETCPTCEGVVPEVPMVTCPDCDGEGEYQTWDFDHPCPICHETGCKDNPNCIMGYELYTVTCKTCGGAGEIPDPNAEKCETCGGKGTISVDADCPDCEDGTVDCPKTDEGFGEGTLTAVADDGEGTLHFVCSDCNAEYDEPLGVEETTAIVAKNLSVSFAADKTAIDAKKADPNDPEANRAAGLPVGYTLTVTNSNQVAAKNITVTVQLTGAVSGIAAEGAAVDEDAKTVTLTLDTLEAVASRTLAISAQTADDAQLGGNIQAQLTASMNDTVLTESEAAQLLKVMKDIAARGIAIIFITHRLDEVINAADGITILRRLRAAPDTAKIPVILLTAKNTEYDKVVGLDTGADDYIPKPFGMMELIARIRAVLRRTEDMQDKDEPRPLVAGGICVDERAHTVFVNEQEVQLTLKEYQLLCLLMKNRGAVLTRDVLLENIWGYNNESETRTVDVHIRTLRQKLGDAGALIETVRGVGYRLAQD